MHLLGNKEWKEVSVFDDDYKNEEECAFSPLDDDWVPEEYRLSDPDDE